MNPKLHMFLSDSNLSYSAWATSEAEAAKLIRESVPSVGRLVYLGAQ
jgi:hypothetical protein